ncbi:MAG: hypothetical protein ACTSX9_00820 [Candidatus Njordarchaeales archaeon]
MRSKQPQKDDKFRSVSLEEFPYITEVGDELEKILRDIFKENYKRYVIRQETSRFIILPPRYLHFPPILITIQPHPNDKERALVINISRRIPIDSQESIPKIVGNITGVLGVDVEVLHRPYKGEEQKDRRQGVEIYYLVLSHRLHVFSLRDKAWFLLILSSMIDVDNKLIVEKEEIISEKRKETVSVEYT